MRVNVLARWSAVLLVALLCGSARSGLAGGGRDAAKNASAADEVALARFVKRAGRYTQLRREATADAAELEPSASPEQIRARERALAEAIRARRTHARPGDIFGPARGSILEIVRKDWRERTTKERSALAVETPKAAVPEVNAAYPEDLPLATFPPELLEALPRLPEELEYRFAGPHLILHDVEANLVVDVAPNVLGSSER
jgi:hypothetical protein